MFFMDNTLPAREHNHVQSGHYYVEINKIVIFNA